MFNIDILMHQAHRRIYVRKKALATATCAHLELELIQTQMTQKPMLRAEVECACVAQTKQVRSVS